MAEGGFDNEDPRLDQKIDHDGDDEDVNRTRLFQPSASSTPYHGGEEHKMTRLPREQSGLCETTPLIPQNNQVWGLVEALYPDADSLEAEAFLDPKSGRLMVRKRGIGKKHILLGTTSRETGKESLNPNLSPELQRALGKNVEEEIAKEKNKRWKINED